MVEIEDTKASYADKLKSALEYLGEKWVLHKNYKFDPKHSSHGFVAQLSQSLK